LFFSYFNDRFNQESVHISSITNDRDSSFCKKFEGIGGYSTNGKLVSGSDKYIDIGKSKMTWATKPLKKSLDEKGDGKKN